MNDLSNAFAVLDLDVEDATVQTTIDATKDGEATVKRDKGKRKGNNSSEMIVAQHDQVDQQSLSTSSEYKLPLVWIDLEMTGLNIDIDRILEIACIITDGNLTKLVEEAFLNEKYLKLFKKLNKVEHNLVSTNPTSAFYKLKPYAIISVILGGTFGKIIIYIHNSPS